MLLTVPAAVALMVIPRPIVSVFFERGAFTKTDTMATSMALAIFAAGLPSFVLIKVFSPAYFARNDTKTTMLMLESASGQTRWVPLHSCFSSVRKASCRSSA